MANNDTYMMKMMINVVLLLLVHINNYKNIIIIKQSRLSSLSLCCVVCCVLCVRVSPVPVRRLFCRRVASSRNSQPPAVIKRHQA